VKYLHLGLLLFYCGFIFYLSDQSSLPTPMLFPHQDKLFHFIAYGILAALALNTLKYVVEPFSLAVCGAFIFCALYGASDEWHQSFVIGRDASFLDWLADCSGAFLALVLYRGALDFIKIIISHFR